MSTDPAAAAVQAMAAALQKQLTDIKAEDERLAYHAPWTPNLRTQMGPHEVQYFIDLPGVTPDQIDLEWNSIGHELKITKRADKGVIGTPGGSLATGDPTKQNEKTNGATQNQKLPAGGAAVHGGPFTLVIVVPNEFDGSRANVVAANGVLIITLPRAQLLKLPVNPGDPGSGT
jgi:HSP20 family molecular chaperone IbpA